MLPFLDCFKESHEIENDEHTMSYQIHKVIENILCFRNVIRNGLKYRCD